MIVMYQLCTGYVPVMYQSCTTNMNSRYVTEHEPDNASSETGPVLNNPTFLTFLYRQPSNIVKGADEHFAAKLLLSIDSCYKDRTKKH